MTKLSYNKEKEITMKHFDGLLAASKNENT